jgi:hypothetical protein
MYDSQFTENTRGQSQPCMIQIFLPSENVTETSKLLLLLWLVTLFSKSYSWVPPTDGEVYWIQHYMIKFVGYLSKSYWCNRDNVCRLFV